MKLRLLILRHAKSERNLPGSSDFDRALTRRGKRAASEIGKAIRDRGLTPQLALCSPARRARQTLELASAEFPGATECRYIDQMYEADADQVMEAIRLHGAAASPLLVVGHNPALQALALEFAGAGPARDIEAIRVAFPTAALAVFEAPVAEWRELTGNIVRLEAYLSLRAGVS